MDKSLILCLQILLCLMVCQKCVGISAAEIALAIHCYQCNSNEETYCSELFNRDGLDLEPSQCEGIYEVKFCIKATGMYEGAIGTRRFCSSRDHGNYCEYVKRPGDEREYRSCVYTCSSDGCNGTNALTKSLFVILISILSCIAWLMLN